MRKALRKKFFERPTLAVARELLGKFLVRRGPSTRSGRRSVIAAMITEVEAYDGPRDRASHASRGLTPRTKVMFGPAGRWYVYFTYGMHWMLNIVTGKKGYPAAVLIRGIIANADPRRLVRGPTRIIKDADERGLINGPGRVTKFFKIDKSFNGKSASRRTGLWIEDRGKRIKKSEIKKDRRVGVDYAGPIWARKKWRFISWVHLFSGRPCSSTSSSRKGQRGR